MTRDELIKSITIDQLKDAYQKIGGIMSEVNLFGIRYGTSSADDMFDDLLGVCINQQAGPIVVPILKCYMGTTDPSKFWTVNPVTYKKVTGAAHLCEGFYTDMWKVGVHAAGTAFAHEALVRSNGMIRFWRDTNKNAIYDPQVDVIQVAPNSEIGINRHRAGLDDPANIGPYGAGCQVFHHHADQQEELALVKNSLMYKTNPSITFNYALFNKSMFE